MHFKPDFVEAYNNLGNVLKIQGKLEEAIACYQESLQHQPDYAQSHNNLGNVLKSQGRLDEAAACYQRALQLEPDHAEGHVDLAMLRLLSGDFENGWREYEWRLNMTQSKSGDFETNRWDGSRLPDKTVLVHIEQGLGDTLQFIRYAALVKQCVGRVAVLCQKWLQPVLSSVAGIDRLITDGDVMPAFDCHVPLLSLPGIFRTIEETIPKEVPYILADATLVESWRARLGGLNGMRVGITWQGNPGYTYDRFRSIPLAHFAPLSERSCSLALDEGAEADATRPELMNRTPQQVMRDALDPFVRAVGAGPV